MRRSFLVEIKADLLSLDRIVPRSPHRSVEAVHVVLVIAVYVGRSEKGSRAMLCLVTALIRPEPISEERKR